MAALLAIGVRYRLGVQGVVEQQLAHWQTLAHEIPHPALRALALAKLREESDNARSAALLATFAPRRRRARVARAIVATEVLFDYLDGRTEAPFGEAQALEGRRAVYRAFTGAVGTPSGAGGETPSVLARAPERDYLLALSGCIAQELSALPRLASVAPHLAAAAARATEAQVRMHAAGELGGEQFERWARRAACGSELGWREHAAGCAASVLCVHALLARAAHDRDRGPDATALDGAYLLLAALAKGLDGLVDGENGPVSPMTRRRERLLGVGARARALTDALGPRHAAILCGLLAHYSCAPAGGREPAAATLAQLAAGRRATVAFARLLLAGTRPRGGRQRVVNPPIATSAEPASVQPAALSESWAAIALGNRRFGARADPIETRGP